MRWVCALVVEFLLCLFISCKEVSDKSSVGFVYPTGWPLPSLTVPTGSTPSKMSRGYSDISNPNILSGRELINGTGRSRLFAVGFQTKSKWKDVKAHLEGGIQVSNYHIIKEEADRVLILESNDGSTEVKLLHFAPLRPLHWELHVMKSEN